MSGRGGKRDTRRSSDGAGFSFPREMRLLRHADFERVYQSGRRHFSSHLTAFYLRRQAGEDLRVGFTVGKVLGGAVDRNRMKRRLREAVRLRRPVTAIPFDVVINPKRSLLTADFDDVLREVSRAFDIIAARSSNQPGENKPDNRKRSAGPS